MNPYALILFVAFLFVVTALFIGGSVDRQHESCQSEADAREFIDPTSRSSRPSVESKFPADLTRPGEIEIICQSCAIASAHLTALPNGDTVCPACHEKAILAAVFTPLE